MTNEDRKALASQAVSGIAEAWNSSGAGLPPLSIDVATGTCTGAVCIGVEAAYYMTTGERNCVIGYLAGRRLRTGSDNVLIGAGAETPAPDTCGFVNINGTCWWRETGEAAETPPAYGSLPGEWEVVRSFLESQVSHGQP